jgi:C4-dicarboxylate-specific signal transduction histidine kinase
MVRALLTPGSNGASAAGWLRRALGSMRVRLATIVLLMAAIFISDTVTDLEIASAVFYIAVILLGVGKLATRQVVYLALACIALTLISFALTRSGERESGVINGVISISAISIATYLALKVVTANAAMHEAREQLIRVARINSLGELAASIAHEVNQPLAAIATSGEASLRWLAASPPNLERARLALGRVAEDANRASTIIARVKAHARGAAPVFRPVQIGEVVRDAVDLSGGEIARHGIALSVRIDDPLPTVLGDKVQLQQVLCNIILNAIEAMVDTPAQARALSITVTTGADGDLEIRADDTGPGIREEHRERLFDAFWTTKGEGTGIGLTICRSIVEGHGGAIWVEDAQPPGSRFRIRLPAHRTA